MRNNYRFTPTAWAKLIFFRDAGDTEVAGFAITSKNDPTLITDVHLVKQKCTGATFDLDVADVDEYMNRMLNNDIPPSECCRILWHTHPGPSPIPSGVDEQNFDKVFNATDFGTMLIISQTSDIYCRTRYNIGPKFDVESNVTIDFITDFTPPLWEAWKEEYKSNVTKQTMTFNTPINHGNMHHPVDEDTFHFMDYYEKSNNHMNTIQDNQDIDEFDCFWYNGYAVCADPGDTNRWLYYDQEDDQWYEEDNENPDMLNPIDDPSELMQQMMEKWIENNNYEEIFSCPTEEDNDD